MTSLELTLLYLLAAVLGVVVVQRLLGGPSLRQLGCAPLEDHRAALVLGLVGHAVGWPIPEGGSQRITDALASHLRSLGGTIQTGTRVTSRLSGWTTASRADCAANMTTSCVFVSHCCIVIYNHRPLSIECCQWLNRHVPRKGVVPISCVPELIPWIEPGRELLRRR